MRLCFAVVPKPHSYADSPRLDDVIAREFTLLCVCTTYLSVAVREIKLSFPGRQASHIRRIQSKYLFLRPKKWPRRAFPTGERRTL